MIDDALSGAQLLALEPLGENRFRSRHNQVNRNGLIFGGQALCQALAAARTTAPEWPANSLSAMFLRPGIVAEPVDYQVDILSQGRRYAVRRVLAMQRGRPIFDMFCSFHDPEEGPSRQGGDNPAVPPPDAVADIRDFCRDNAHRLPAELVGMAERPFPIDLRPIDPDPTFFGDTVVTRRDFWFRIPTAKDIADPRAHESLLAFASDYGFAGTASAGHEATRSGRRLSLSSVSHSLWFHGPVDTGDWLLFRTDSPWAGSGRGLARGLVYDRADRLVASVAQEVSVRVT